MHKIRSEQEWNRLFNSAEEQRQQGALVSALDAYRSLLFYRLQNEGTDLAATFTNYDAIVVERLADLSTYFGSYQATSSLLSGLQQLAEQVDNVFLSHYTSIKRAYFNLTSQHDLEACRDALATVEKTTTPLELIDDHNLPRWETAHPLYRGGNERERAILYSRLYMTLGKMLVYLGQYGSAERFYRRAEEVTSNSAFPAVSQLQRPVRLDLARCFYEKGQIDRAESLLDTIAPTAGDSRTSGYGINWKELRAACHYLRGQLGKAKQLQVELRQDCANLGALQAELSATCNLAQIAILLNQVAYARDLLRAAAALADQLGSTTGRQRIEQLRQLAQQRIAGTDQDSVASRPLVQIRTGEGSDLPVAGSRAVASLLPPPRQKGTHLHYFEDRALHWQMLLSAGHWEEAERQWTEIEEVFSRTDSQLIHSRSAALSLLRSHVLQLIDANRADRVARAHAFFRKYDMLPELWQLQRFLSWDRRLSDQEKNALTVDNQHLLDGMMDSLASEDKAIFLLNKWEPNEEYLLQKVEELQGVADKYRLAPHMFKRWWQRYILNNKIGKFRGYVDAHRDYIVQHVGRNDSAGIAWSSIRRRWWRTYLFSRRDSVELSFLVLPDRVVIVLSGRWLFRFFSLPISRIELREWIREWHQLLTDVDPHNRWLLSKKPAAKRQDNRERRRALLSQIAEKLHLDHVLATIDGRVKRLRIVPDDALYGLPFSALPWQRSYLIERFAISLRFQSQRASPPRKKIERAVLNGVAKTKGYNDLPSVASEIAQVDGLLRKRGITTEVLIDQITAPDQLVRKMEETQLFHFAGHGTFDPVDPGRSGLLMSNGEVLTLRILLEQGRLQNLTHVTLSSCWAADHFILPGRWIISLPSTLCWMGVGSVLSCLWEVSDTQAVRFITDFYQACDKYPRDIALQKTILQRIDDGAEFNWAGFQLYGSELAPF